MADPKPPRRRGGCAKCGRRCRGNICQPCQGRKQPVVTCQACQSTKTTNLADKLCRGCRSGGALYNGAWVPVRGVQVWVPMRKEDAA